ncbi:MAG: glycosyltransferase family 39 protein [Anaerolineae bacterium]|nr:glycosyltransferase family 39 protein [Anaerolineae bacterium]
MDCDPNRRWWAALIPLLLLAAVLRWSGVAWDGGIGAHPDERYVVGIAEGLAWPDRLDPFALAPDYAYGHLPLYLIALLGGQNRLFAARFLAGLFDVGTVALAAALGRRVFDRWVGLGAALFLAVMPLHVQLAHFATVDPFLAFFATGTLLFAARFAGNGHRRDALLAGLWAGLALSCKAGAALLAFPLAMACWAAPPPGRAARAWTLAGVAVVAFALTSPAALLDAARFVRNVGAQAALLRGAGWVPYTFQYHGTWPYLYPIAQQLLWGMGPVLGLVCFGGAGWVVWRAACQPPTPAGWVVLAWVVPCFAFTAALAVKFPRYLLPLTPLLAVYGAWAVRGLAQRSAWLGRFAVVLAALPAAALSLALVLSYRVPHPWVAASEWLRETIPSGAVIAVEAWDHPLPLDATGYDVLTLPIFEPDTEAKWVVIDAALDEADVLVLASRRGYGALADWPEQFPHAGAFYRALLAGERGFRVVACFGRWPALGPLAFADDPFTAVGLSRPACPSLPSLWLPRLDESFTVYDHPLVIVLRR